MLPRFEFVHLEDPLEDPQLAQEVARLVIDEIGNYCPDEDEIETQLRLMKGKTTVTAIDDEGQVLGTGSVLVHSSQPSKGEIDDVAVSGEYKGDGLGTAIMQKLESIARERGAQTTTVEPLRGGRVIKFYKENGYQQAGKEMVKTL